MEMYFSGLKLIHVISMATWFGTVVAVGFLWTLAKQGNEGGKTIAFALIKRIENIASIGVIITAILMLIHNPALFQQGWIHIKILLWIIAEGLLHASKALLGRHIESDDKENTAFDYLRSALLLVLIIAITMAIFKPF